MPGLDAVVQGFLHNALGLGDDAFGESEYRRGDKAGRDLYVPVLYVQVPRLPKDASIEVQPFLYAPLPAEGDLDDDPLPPTGLAGGPKEPSRGWHRGLRSLPVREDSGDARGTQGSALVFEGMFGSCSSGSKCPDLSGACEDLAAAAAETLSAAKLEWRHSIFCRVHCLPSVGSLEEIRRELQRAFSARGATHPVPLQVAPCSGLALGQEEGLFAAIHMVAVL